ncbi:MAG: RagB/SusD family nutrient uptake outer membrane protein, partial [Chitinophagales bacterium]
DVKGEAYTIRAMVHFDLLRTFGEHWDMSSEFGIPLVMDATDPLQPRGRNTVQECYEAIVDDLNAALDLVSNDDVESGSGSKTAAYITVYFVDGLLARVYLYMKDFENAAAMADEVILSGTFSLTNNPALIYTTKLSSESIFELQFNVQDQSQYNSLTYVRGDALRVDVSFLANEDLNLFFESRPDDLRAQSVDFNPDNNDGSIQPDGRTQKYRGEETKDNSAYVLRIAEMYLVAAEAKGLAGGGLDNLNMLRESRGLNDLVSEDFDTPQAYQEAVQDERRAELNFEGHRYFDLARIGKVSSIVGEDVQPVFPIPANQVSASGGTIEQYPGY